MKTRQATSKRLTLLPGNPTWNQSPSQFDRFLVKRQSPVLCGEPSGNREDYNLELHVGSVFVILFVSASACAFPIVATKVRGIRVPPRFLFFVRHFGTGVLLATAFAHLFPTAFTNLTNPCLGSFWTDDYPALAGVIALAAVFIVAIIEQVFSPGRHCCAMPVMQTGSTMALDKVSGEPEPKTGADLPPPTPLYGRTKLGRSDSTGQHLARMTSQSAQLDRVERLPARESSPVLRRRASASAVEAPTKLRDVESLTEQQPSKDQKREKLLLQCILLEVGILFHSVFIGMALAVAIGSDFVVLLIAIIFHQTFEGLALGSRIAAVGWSNNDASGWRRYQPWLMALAYGCTTPVGQALGIATHTLYSPESTTGLLMVGIMSSSSPFLQRRTR
jgi:solute carrier family 39 (zinc transporter), member 1/2/3